MKRFYSYGLMMLICASACHRRQKIVLADAGPPVEILTGPPGRVETIATGSITAEKEPNDTIETAQKLSDTGTVAGTMTWFPQSKAKPLIDVDYYLWTPPAADAGLVSLQIAIAPDPEVDIVLEVVRPKDPKWRIRSDNAKAGGEEQLLDLVGSAAEPIFVRVSQKKSPTEPHDGKYRLVTSVRPLAQQEEREPNNKCEETNPLIVGEELSGRLDRPQDQDWIFVDQKRDGSHDFFSFQISPVAALGLEVAIYETDQAGAACSLVTKVKGRMGQEIRMRNVTTRAGTFPVIALRPLKGAGPDANWRLSVRSEAPLTGSEVEPNDGLAQAMRVEVGSEPVSVFGFLWNGDTDVFCPNRTAGGAVSASIKAPAGVELTVATFRQGLRQPSAVVSSVDLNAGDCLEIKGRPQDVIYDEPYDLRFTPGP